MDIYCPIANCREPVEIDYLHDIADERNMTFDEVRKDFAKRGCLALLTSHNCPDGEDMQRDAVADAIFDLLGDDIDGAACAFEDAEHMGLF